MRKSARSHETGQPLSQHLFGRLRGAGAECTFGIPGDFALPLYAAQERRFLKACEYIGLAHGLSQRRKDANAVITDT